MFNYFGYLALKLSAIVKVATDIFKISLFFGIVLAIYYFYKINYVPKDLTIGDGFLFILISCKYAFISSVYVGALLVLGFIVFNFFKAIVQLYKYGFQAFDRLLNKLLTFHVSNSWFEKIAMFTGSLIIIPLCYYIGIAIWGETWSGIGLLLLSVIITYIFFSLFIDSINDKKLDNDMKNFRMTFTIILTFFIPIYTYSSLSKNEKLTDFALNSLQESDKNAIYYVKKEHKDLFPKNNVAEHGEYVILKEAKVILRGFGRNALIEYRPIDKYEKVASYTDKVEVPNNDLQIKWESDKGNAKS
ncbi:hypothetical protein [Acinetobacter sp. HZNU-JH01]|uniref:hypothetical protein n=1 Tax=Acinetobacter sp. HZNU-JH01 TaxID=3136280 RepID=UPI0030F474D1